MHVSSKLKKKPADAAALRKCDESREERREYARRKGEWVRYRGAASSKIQNQMG